MKIPRLFATFVMILYSTTPFAQQITGPAVKIEGNKAVPMSKEEAACGLIRQQTTQTTAVCEERHARQNGLPLALCSTLSRAATEVCDAYSQSFIQQPPTFAQCLKASDRHRKCALAITAGCEYTKVLAQKLESVEGTKDVDFIVGAIKSECPIPNVPMMAVKAQTGALRVLAMPESK